MIEGDSPLRSIQALHLLRIWQLSKEGEDLSAKLQFREALEKFNEGFQTLTNIMDSFQRVRPLEEESKRSFASRVFPLVGLFQVMAVDLEDNITDEYCLDEWIEVTAIKLIYNGALMHYRLNALGHANKLVDVALQFQNSSNSKVQSCIFCVYGLGAKVQSNILAARSVNGIKVSASEIEECVNMFSEALLLAEELWGARHLVLASVYGCMGEFLLRLGYSQGSSYAFSSMDEIYNVPRPLLSWNIFQSTHEGQSNIFGDDNHEERLNESVYMADISTLLDVASSDERSSKNDTGCALSDLQVARIFLQDDTWSYGASVA